jgi:hypothetical protein
MGNSAFSVLNILHGQIEDKQQQRVTHRKTARDAVPDLWPSRRTRSRQ